MDLTMIFNEWIKDDLKRIYISSKCKEPVWIELLVLWPVAKVKCKDTGEAERWTKVIEAAGFDFSKEFKSWDDLVKSLFKLPGKHTRFEQKQRSSTHEVPEHKTNPPVYSSKIDSRSSNEISDNSYSHNVASAPFKPSTVANCKVFVDTKFPQLAFKKLSEGRIKVERTELEIGDLQLRSKITEDHVVITRKTVTEFAAEFDEKFNPDCENAKKLFLYQQKQSAAGVKVLVIWAIEGEKNGSRMLYNSFTESNRTDGVVSYLMGGLDQHVIQAFNVHHFSYLVMRLVQRFFEREPNMILVNEGESIDSSKERLLNVLTSFPNISNKIAKSMIESGLHLREILSLTESDLLRFDGVGKQTAKKIISELSI